MQNPNSYEVLWDSPGSNLGWEPRLLSLLVKVFGQVLGASMDHDTLWVA